jgi:peptidoglycan/xylan/chitin deacetylase (PgdA/CDA1 family)
MWESSRKRKGPTSIAGGVALALATVLALVIAWSSLRDLPSTIDARLHLGGQFPEGPPVQVQVERPAGVPRAAPTPPGPEPVIPLGRSSVHVPILEYHYIRVNPDSSDQLGYNLSVTPKNFKAQMDWLAAHRYHPIDLAELRAYFAGQQVLPARPVVLTFDDGYEDFYATAWPILRAHGFTAVSYVVPGFLGRKNYMKSGQVGELDRAGIEIGSHTVHHVDLTKLDPTTAQVELVASRGHLEQVLGHPVLDFCYPFGRFDETAKAAVGAAGYESATTEVAGATHSWDTRWAWTRVRVSGGEQLSAFADSLGSSDPAQL